MDLLFSAFYFFCCFLLLGSARQAESATSKAQTQRLSTLPNEGQIISVFETSADFDPSEIQRLHRFVATGVGLLICTLYAEAKDSATWPKVNS